MKSAGFQALQTEPCAWIVVDKTGEKPVVCGMATAHVDDFLFAGDDGNALWRKAVSTLYEAYQWSNWQCDDYTHCGVHVVQRPDHSEYSEYCATIEPIPIAKDRSEKDVISENERQQLRGILGAIQWRVYQSKCTSTWSSLESTPKSNNDSNGAYPS